MRVPRDSSLISTSVRMVHSQRTSDEKRPGRGRQRINPREFATTGPRTPEIAANYLLHRGLRQDGGGDQRGVSVPLGFIWSRLALFLIEQTVKNPVEERLRRPPGCYVRLSVLPDEREAFA
jgi:hypothetical protein